MKRFAILVAAVTAACAEALVGASPSRDPAALAEITWRDFDRNYGGFIGRQIDWDAARATYVPRAAAAQTPTQLAEAISGMLDELADIHVSLYVPELRRDYRNVALIRPQFYAPQFVPLTGAGVSATGRLRYGWLGEGIAYLRIRDFGGSGWSAEVDDVLQRLGMIDTLVIDVRSNGGGSTDNSEPLLGRFVDRRVLFSHVRFRSGPAWDDLTDYAARYIGPKGSRRFLGPVILLTNRGCVSTTEDFILAMRARGNVTVYGDTTAGAHGNPIVRELPNGWTYRLPIWVLYDAMRRQLVEGEGIAPDVLVKTTRDDSLAQRDPVIARLLADRTK